MPLFIATPIIIILAAAGIIGVAAFQFSRQSETVSEDVLGVSSSPTVTISPDSSPSVSPSADSSPSSASPWSAYYVSPSVNVTPSGLPSRLPHRPATTPDLVTNQNQGEVDIRFIKLPSSVRSGQSFTIAWQVTAPSPTSGSNTTLKIVRKSNQQTGVSSSMSNSTSSQSFGAFTTPASFDADFTFAGDPGDIEVEVTATVGGKTITKNTTINFES